MLGVIIWLFILDFNCIIYHCRAALTYYAMCFMKFHTYFAVLDTLLPLDDDPKVIRKCSDKKIEILIGFCIIKLVPLN